MTKATATVIRGRLESSSSLLLAISTNAAISKWMPWELGYVDGNTKKCAIMPVSRNDYAPNSYVGIEYLTLYPFVKKVPTQGLGDKLFVIEEKLKYIIFENWLRYGEQPRAQTVNIF